MTIQSKDETSALDETRSVMRDAHGLQPDTADAVARDLASSGTRKPASDDVDAARAVSARSNEPVETVGDDAPGDVDLGANIDPSDPALDNVDESVERAGW